MTKDDVPLYPSEAMIARKIFGEPGRVTEWKGLVQILEREGFPKIEPGFGARYWPACEAWFLAKHRLLPDIPGRFGPPDGVETRPEPRRRPGIPSPR